MPALIGGALTGAGIGFAQWLMLRRSLGVGLESDRRDERRTGRRASNRCGRGELRDDDVSARHHGRNPGGVFVGIAQGMVLRNKFSRWHVWMVAMPVFFAIAWVVTYVVELTLGQQFTVFGASGAVVFAILSGLLLIAGMRREKSASA